MNLKDANILKKNFFSGPKALQSPFPERDPFNGSTSDPDLTVLMCDIWVHALIFGTFPLPPRFETPRFQKPLGRNQTANISSGDPFLLCVSLYDTASPVIVTKVGFHYLNPLASHS